MLYKNILNTLLFVLLATGLSSCDSDKEEQTAQKSTTSSAKKAKMGVSIYNGEVAFVANYTANLTKQAKEISNLEFDLVDAKNDQEEQIKQLTNFVKQGKNVLLVNLVSTNKEAAAKVIALAKPNDLPVIFYHRYPGSGFYGDYDKAYYVGTIPAQSGVLQGELVAKNWVDNPNWDLNKDGVLQYVILKGKPGNPDAEGRTEWVAKTITSYPGKQIATESLDIGVANWSRDEAKEMVKSWLNGPLGEKIEVIISNNDAMALGAVDALEEAGKSLPIFGVDALPDAVAAIKSGKMVASVGQDVKAQSQVALSVAINLVNGRNPSENLQYSANRRHEITLPYVSVDKKNANSWGK